MNFLFAALNTEVSITTSMTTEEQKMYVVTNLGVLIHTADYDNTSLRTREITFLSMNPNPEMTAYKPTVYGANCTRLRYESRNE